MLLVLIITEILSFLVLKEFILRYSKTGFFILLTLHLAFSTWLWIAFIRVKTWDGFFDSLENIYNQMILNGLLIAVLLNRILIICLHYLGKLLRKRSRSYIESLTATGFISATVYFLILASGFLIGRFNFKTEQITIEIKDLKKELDGFRIVHIADLHLSGFCKHSEKLAEAVEIINSLNPDLIINSGDFVSYGWREYDNFDTILIKAKSKYGNFAVLGNHDMGTYLPDNNKETLDLNSLRLKELIASSGYILLENEYSLINTGKWKIAVIGVKTGGSHPFIIHSDVNSIIKNIDSTDLKIMICHDPNQWKEDIAGKTDIDITLSGHSHGMQMGVITRNLRWSTAKYLYPQWNGLFSEDNQYHYVNRGAGVLSVPFRIWMPPEITLITLKAG
ncbi:MAG TPA: metallophosphoesterase [Bacteroidales bacterium]|nr:metallophosphoesterase [Bacteroidales bacterium]